MRKKRSSAPYFSTKLKLVFGLVLFALLVAVISISLSSSTLTGQIGISLRQLPQGRSSQQENPTPTTSDVYLPSISQSGQDDPTAEWKVYKNEATTLMFGSPKRLIYEEYGVVSGTQSELSVVLAGKLSSPEALPEAIIPSEQEAFRRFQEQYILVYFKVYDNSLQLPLIDGLRQIYSQRSIDPEKTVFELMEPNLLPYNGRPEGALVFEGPIGDNPKKSVFISHNNRIYEFTLFGGPDTGSSYSNDAERDFDLVVSSISFME